MSDDNYTKFPNAILDSVELDVYEFRILSIIIRKTIGYNKKSDGISLSQFVKFGKMGKPKVISTLKKLKGKGLITTKKQKTKTGAHSYTRYSLRVASGDNHMVSEDYKGSNPEIQGVVTEDYTHKDNNTKENRQNNERENSFDKFSDIYFTLNARDQAKEVDKYIQDVIAEIEAHTDVRSERALKAKLRKKFQNKDKGTLEEFERWYLEKVSNELMEKHKGREINIAGINYQIKHIYPYFQTEGYHGENKLYISITDNQHVEKVAAYSNTYEAQKQLEEWSQQ